VHSASIDAVSDVPSSARRHVRERAICSAHRCTARRNKLSPCTASLPRLPSRPPRGGSAM